ncbi:protein-glutamate O-methyltransferase CheR [Thiofaba sp. EF100]|jgi:chemotaxis protein methyltransferase CheR|uniref:CheR family methyltransferase n=1 Tax=Thiofaba sp. EF100 TaxID=3121274 RepID=UPI00322202A8
MQSSADEQAFAFLQRFIERESGIVIADNKRYLLEVRLAPLMRSEGLASFGELVAALQGPRGASLRPRIIESMTTHETLWFRDRFPFEFFRDHLLKEHAQSNDGPLTVWSAACATGQEPYSLSILAEEFAAMYPRSHLDVKILATDISTAALETARQGVYDALALRRGMDEVRLRRFFTESAGGWRVRPEVAARITFRPLNLLASFPHVGKFHVIFCRNVLIYFTGDRKADILDRLLQTLHPGGHLVLGASETIPEPLMLKHQLARLARGGGIYRKQPASAGRP